MPGQRHYARPPITEAIIDLRVQLAETVDHARLRSLNASVDDQYPHVTEILAAVGQMEIGPRGGSASVSQNVIGFRRASTDGRQIFQSRFNGFAFSRLAPYDRWQSFRDEARRLWGAYRDLTKPEQVHRLAVRYINRIDVPGATVDLKEYFRTSPEVAPELPQNLEGFFMQLRLPCTEISSQAVINQTIVPPSREGVVSIVLDVDLFRTEALPQDDVGIWEFFEVLHEWKNTIFEACITDAARRLFDSCQS